MHVCVSKLPAGDTITFDNFTFDASDIGKKLLPPPAEVRRHATLQGTKYPTRRVPPVIFPSQGLIVKSGSDITVEEGKCLWALKRKLHGRVPVPTIYGWCRDNEEVFIYMEFVKGETLEEIWERLRKEERVGICEELREMLIALRALEPDPDDISVGSIARTQLEDAIFEFHPYRGPFLTVKQFHDWYAALSNPKAGKSFDPIRPQLSDEAAIKFTHGDLHPSNIIVSSESNGNPKIVAIIDWHQSGWYPDYWEYNKALWTAKIGGEWATEYVPRFVEGSSSDEAWDFYMHALGC